MFYPGNGFLCICARRVLYPLAFLATCLVPIPAISAPVVYFSTKVDDAIPGVAGPFDDADIYAWDSGSGAFSRMIDASAGGFPTNADIDGLQVAGPDDYYLSFRRNKGTVLPELGKVEDEDVIRYQAGVLTMYLDGSDVGLASNDGEDIDALAVLGDGSVVVSTYSSPKLPGASGLADEDLVRCAGAFGNDSSCTWELYFDGSDVGLSNSGEDVDAVSVSGDTIALSTLGSFDVSGLSGSKADIFECTSAMTGPSTACGAFSMLLDGDAYGLAGNIDAISVTGAGVLPSRPTAVDDLNNSTNDGVPINIDVLANDRDGPAPIDPATVTIVDLPSKGSATALTDGTVDYAPSPGETGQDSFTYTVGDEQGQTSNLATVEIEIDSTGGGDPGIVTPISPSGVITTRTPAYTWQPDPNADRYKVRVNDSTGAKKINTWYTATEAGCASGQGTCSITPAYQLADGDGSWKVKAANDSVVAPFSDLLLFTVSIGGGNMAPISNDDTSTVDEGTDVTINVAANDTDPDGTINPASISIIGNPSHGTIDAVNDNGTITYTADAPYNGPDSFTYTINDNQGLTSNVAAVRISVIGSTEAGLVFVGDFENGFDGWDLTELCCDHSLNLIDTPTRVGNGAARFQILRDDPLIAGANRAELKLDNDALETEYWYGWSTMLPSDWVIDTSLEIIAQFHLPSGSGGPPLRFKTDGEKLIVNTKTQKDGKDVRKTVFSEEIVSSTMKGNWTDFVVNVIWTTGDHGHLRIWINGEQVVDEPGSTNFIDTSAPYYKIGLYKTAWRDNKPSIVDSRVIYHDEVRVARGPNGYALVDPASQ